MELAVGLSIISGQLLSCLHPPAGAVALLGAKPSFMVMPILVGTLQPVPIPSTGFNRLWPRPWETSQKNAPIS
jgi:hypothetical protein